MKKVFVVSFKILLPMLFLYNIGFFSLNFSKLLIDTNQNPPFNQKNNSELIKFVNEKSRVAQKKGQKIRSL